MNREKSFYENICFRLEKWPENWFETTITKECNEDISIWKGKYVDEKQWFWIGGFGFVFSDKGVTFSAIFRKQIQHSWKYLICWWFKPKKKCIAQNSLKLPSQRWIYWIYWISVE